MRFGLVSLDQVWLNKIANMNRCAQFVSAASKASCDVIVFPEMTLTGYTMDSKAISESSFNSPSLDWFAGLSSYHKINIIFGAVLSDNSSHLPFNAMCLATPNGQASIVYKKIHPFSYAQEDLHYTAGTNLNVLQIGYTKILPAICYDLRFQYLFSLSAPLSDMFW